MTPQLYMIINSLRRFFGHHHPVIFISIVGILIAVATLSLYQVFSLATDTESSNTSSTIGNFNKEAIDKIKQLHDSTNANTSINLPPARPNPFVE